MSEPRWWSLCCGLAATECYAMSGSFPPVTRMGGKRAVAAHVLDILGTWPQRWVMVDADVAIVEFWQAAFGGRLPAVAEVIRNVPADGEELWKLWMGEAVPVHPDERLARWVVGQKGNFNGKPLSWGEKWEGVGGFSHQSTKAAEEGYPDPLVEGATADRVEAFWKGMAGYKSLSDLAVDKGFREQVLTGATAESVESFAPSVGETLYLDLATSSPVFRPGDLVTIDPPYAGTTGYGSKLTRERVVELALEAHECGCRVLVHEAEPVRDVAPGLWIADAPEPGPRTVSTGGPWRAAELERRRGRNQRTWSSQRSEWVTINFEPARTVSHTMAVIRTAAGFDGPLFDADRPR